MKLIVLVTAFAVPVFAQEAKPDAKPAPPAEAKPAAPPQELPPLPAPAPGKSEPDLSKGQPGGRLKPASDGSNPLQLPDALATQKKKKDDERPGMPPKGKSTLRPPITAADLDARIRFRQTHTRVVNEPAIQSLWQVSRVAPTDYEKREALKTYYTALFKKMAALDKSIVPLIEERKRVALHRLDQTRIEPTDPLDEEHRMRLVE